MFSMYLLWVRWQSSVKFQLFTPAYKNLSCCNFQLSVKFQINICNHKATRTHTI